MGIGKRAIRVGNTFSETEVDALQAVCRAATMGVRIEPYALPGFRTAYQKIVKMRAACDRMAVAVEAMDNARKQAANG